MFLNERRHLFQLKPIKNIPALICDLCLKSLYDADQFRLKCLEADEYFQKLTSTQDSDLLEEELTENCWTISDLNEVTAEPISQLEKRDESPQKLKTRKMKIRYKPICGYCGKEQESEYRLKQHELLSHTPLNQLSSDELFVCDRCDRKFKTKQSIRNHFIRAHTPKSEVSCCSICGKVRNFRGKVFHMINLTNF